VAKKKSKLSDIHQVESKDKEIWRAIIVIVINEERKEIIKSGKKITNIKIIKHTSRREFDGVYSERNKEQVMKDIEEKLNLCRHEKYEVISIDKIKLLGYAN
jgi:hypothetical protein